MLSRSQSSRRLRLLVPQFKRRSHTRTGLVRPGGLPFSHVAHHRPRRPRTNSCPAIGEPFTGGFRASPIAFALRLRLYASSLRGLFMRRVVIAALCAALGGCASPETVAFRASGPQQQALMRDGQPALVSRQKTSLVLVRPASRKLQARGRPVFVVGINNLSGQPIDFRVDRVEAIQHVGGTDYVMQVVTYDMLANEERNRQIAAAILTGVAAVGNAYSASQAGNGYYTTPNGRTGTFYSPTAAAIAQNNAAAQNEEMIAATVETGQRNMAMLEQSVIKDNTLMPGEWYGGQLHLAPPTDKGGAQKSYTIIINVGNDRHVIDCSQGPAGT